MEAAKQNITAQIKDGQYFTKAQNWYKQKYIHPFTNRSVIAILLLLTCMIFFTLLLVVNGLFPLVQKVRYTITSDISAEKSAQIHRANRFEQSPLFSIADIMIRNYVTIWENYDYQHLPAQFKKVKNISTRIVARKFYSWMNINNPNSPILKYQQDIRRTIDIIESKILANNKAIVQFESKAQNMYGELFENTIWEAKINFEIDDIDVTLPHNSPFNFTVTEYEVHPIKNKLSKT